MKRRPYRVLLVLLSQTFGGAEARVLAQAQAFQDRVERCAVAVLKNSPLHRRLQQMGLPVEPIGSGRGSPVTLFAIRRIIKAGGYNVVDAHNVQSILWGHLAAWLSGVQGSVTTVHSDFGKEYPGLKGQLYEAVLALDRYLTDQYVTVTEVLQHKIEQQGDANRSTLIHNAVHVPPEPFAGVDPAQRRAWGFTGDDFVVAIVARLKPVKGHRYLFEALAHLHDLPQLKLLVAGDGPLRDDLEALAHQLQIADRVHFAGFVRDIPDLMRAVDVVCLASLSEALPYVVLEAAACARPLLVTRVGGMATLLEHQVNAVLVPPGDSLALAEALRWMVAHPERTRQLGLAAYDLVRQSFSVEQMVTRVLGVYDRAMQ
ncbi:MAG: glycosyltransferase [Anaerolineae bacterium]